MLHDEIHRLFNSGFQADPVTASPLLHQARSDVVLDLVHQGGIARQKVVNKLAVRIGLAQDLETVIPIERLRKHLDASAFDIWIECGGNMHHSYVGDVRIVDYIEQKIVSQFFVLLHLPSLHGSGSHEGTLKMGQLTRGGSLQRRCVAKVQLFQQLRRDRPEVFIDPNVSQDGARADRVDNPG